MIEEETEFENYTKHISLDIKQVRSEILRKCKWYIVVNVLGERVLKEENKGFVNLPNSSLIYFHHKHGLEECGQWALFKQWSFFLLSHTLCYRYSFSFNDLKQYSATVYINGIYLLNAYIEDILKSLRETSSQNVLL